MYPEEDEEDEEGSEDWLRSWGISSRYCDGCGSPVGYTEEVYSLQVCGLFLNELGQVVTEPVMFDEQPAFASYLLHFMCWERILDDIHDVMDDVPPHPTEDPALICTVCESLIGAHDCFVEATFAEVHVSRRMPSGNATDCITPMHAADVICIECMSTVIDDHFPEWEDVLTHLPPGYFGDEHG